jgi:hypothetical protein
MFQIIIYKFKKPHRNTITNISLLITFTKYFSAWLSETNEIHIHIL